MIITNSTLADVNTIFDLYDAATAHQKIVSPKHWEGFEKSLVEKEIEEKRQWKIIDDDKIRCVFAIAFSDPHIWEEKDKEPSIYIHRIATHPLHRGKHYVKHIAEWAKQYAKAHNKAYVRLDTWGGNDKLNQYYMNCGFNYIGVIQLKSNNTLPVHYKEGDTYTLFEIKI